MAVSWVKGVQTWNLQTNKKHTKAENTQNCPTFSIKELKIKQ